MANQQFNDQQIMTDALATQKFLTSDYNTSANECASPKLRDEFMSLLSDEHQIQADVFDELHKRGWYETTPADKTKIDQAKTKYAGPGAAY